MKNSIQRRECSKGARGYLRPGLVMLCSLLMAISLLGASGCGSKKDSQSTEEVSGGQAVDEIIATEGSGETEGSPQAQDGQADGTGAAGGQENGTVDSAATGEDYSVTTPSERYVSETQRHQNFLAAVALGEVRRMDFTSTDFQPVDDPNSSYITFSLTSSDGSRSDGTLVMKFESGMWRLSAVKQLSGNLGGGTNYLVPASFEDTLAAELGENQPFFTKLAEGRVSALIVSEVQHPSDTETVLLGQVVGRGGRAEDTEMYLRKDYNLWHLTGFGYR